jgi:hypothetical protein
MVANDPRNYGEQIAQGIPGVGILMMLRQLGEALPGKAQQALELLGIQRGPQWARGGAPTDIGGVQGTTQPPQPMLGNRPMGGSY